MAGCSHNHGIVVWMLQQPGKRKVFYGVYIYLPDLPNGVRARLKRREKEGNDRGDGMWTRGNCMDEDGDTTLGDVAAREYGTLEVNRLAKAWKQRTEAIINHYHNRK